MTRRRLLDALAERPLLGDGAMGTQLQNAGLGPGQCGEGWNLDRPRDVQAIQRRYADAGSDCVITNTFGASAPSLRKHGLAEKVAHINRAGAEIARRAVGEEGFVLGDIGPTGEMLEPLGSMSAEEMRAVFFEQAHALIDGGVDAVIVETMMAVDELVLALLAVRDVDPDVPLVASMAYDPLANGGYATMMGIRPDRHAAEALAAGADIIACNCGTNLAPLQHAEILRAFRAACDAPLMTQPNAGKPEMKDGQAIYRETPEDLAAHVPALVEAGARIVGGCCGTTPDHIAAFRKALDDLG